MKKLIQIAVAASLLLNTPLVQAWTYSDGHALLIFRETDSTTSNSISARSANSLANPTDTPLRSTPGTSAW